MTEDTSVLANTDGLGMGITLGDGNDRCVRE